MNLKNIQKKKKEILFLGLIIIISICVPLLILALIKYDNSYTVEYIYFESHDDTIISGIIYKPNRNVFQGQRPGIVCLHDFMESKESMSRFSEDLVRAGFVVLAYDQRGFGNSETMSHFCDPNYEIRDLEISINYLKSLDYVDSKAIGIIGLGYGGAVALMGAGILKEKLNATFIINSFNNISETLNNINFNSIQAKIMKIISKYLGYIPSINFPNELSEEQSKNLEGFIKLIGDIPSIQEFQNFIYIKKNELRFNQTNIKHHSPSFKDYISKIKNESLYLTVGTKDDIYPYNSSKLIKIKLENKYHIKAFYESFEGAGHNIKTDLLDYALINFFNFKLRDIDPPDNNFLEKPEIPELGGELDFNGIKNQFHEFNFIIIYILIPYLCIIVFFYIFLIKIYNLREIPELESKKQKKTKKKEIIQKYTDEQRRIIRRIDKKKILTKKELMQPEISFKEKSDHNFFLQNKNLGVIIIIFTLINLILIPTIGMTYVNFKTLLFWICVLVVNVFLSLLFYSNIETWKWKNSSKEQKIRKNNIHNLKTQKLFFQKFIIFLRKSPFYQIIFYLSVLFCLIIGISFLIAPLQLRLVEFGLAQIFSILIISGIIITLLALTLIWFDKKWIQENALTLKDYGLGKKQILKGFGFGIYSVQIPLLILIIGSYILMLSQPFLPKSYSFIFIGLPFVFLYFFGFELIFRSLIQNKIKGKTKKEKIGEFFVGTLLYAQFIGIFSYLIFMNSYTSRLFFFGLPISYSGIFGLIFICFALIGTFTYMITRTPVASSISNTLLFFIVIAIIV
ncbi:MAG: alpha/beta hydrolase [Promethearchaeota archaeon]